MALTPRSSSVHEYASKRDPDGAAWRKYHDDMLVRMQVDKLREATRKRDRMLLERALSEAHNANLEADDDVKKAEHTLAILTAKHELQQAYNSNDAVQIRQAIAEVKAKGRLFVKNLQHEIHEASVKADSLERMNKSKGAILTMNTKTMSEIRRYHNPPKVLHKVMQATFLLLGHDEERTSDWPYCQKLCNPQGSNGLNRRVLDYDASKVHPEIGARAKEILSDFDLKDVQAVSPGAGTFYVWSMGVIDEVQQNRSDSQRGQVSPAGINRQQEILGVSSKDSVLRSPKKYRRKNPNPNPADANIIQSPTPRSISDDGTQG